MRQDVIWMIALVVVVGIAAYFIMSGISSGFSGVSGWVTSLLQGSSGGLGIAPTSVVGWGLVGYGLLTFATGGILPLALGAGALGWGYLTNGSLIYGGGSGGGGGATGSW